MDALDAAIQEILEDSDLASVSVKAVRKQLATLTDPAIATLLSTLEKDQIKHRINTVYDRVANTETAPSPDLKPEIKHETLSTDEALARLLQSQEEEEQNSRSRTTTRRSTTAATPQKKKRATTKKPKDPSATPKTTGFTRPQILSPALERLLKSIPVSLSPDAEPTLPDQTAPLLLSRPEVVKRLWIHIKKLELQDPSDKRMILCDEGMQEVMGVKRVSMFKMNSLLSAHFTNASEVYTQTQLESMVAPSATSSVAPSAAATSTKSKSTPRGGGGSKTRKSDDFVVESDEEGDEEEGDEEEEDEDEDEILEEHEVGEGEDGGAAPPARKKAKKSGSSKRKSSEGDADDHDDDDAAPKKKSKSVFSKEYTPSPALSAVVGSSDPLPRHQAVKLIWVYIKAHDRQDPNDKRFILCDEKLEAVMGVKRVSMFAMNKVLGDHLFAIEKE
ncbi:hypothetical protein HDU98_001526 [Podochytrium sp. JEL0797]|nr:hypothetical protein HDU98_001526 [Podochytrium sp. JEL0797]